MNAAIPQAPFRFRTLLPVEHGSWVFLLLPMVVGLAKAPSLGGLGLAAASLAVFLGRTPVQRWGRLQRGPRLYAALAFLGMLGMGGLALTWFQSGWMPLAVLGLGGLALVPALRGGARRALGPELLGAAGAAALLPALLMAGGGTARGAAVAFSALLALEIPPFLFVRRQVAWARRDPFALTDAVGLHGAHALACGLALLAWHRGWTGLGLPAWTLLLWGRTLVVRAALPARKVGWLEAGVALVHGVVLGLALKGV